MSVKRLAIVGCGSSGLITLKWAVERLPDWEVVCFEKSNSIVGCWGNPPPGFVSTSTKYTTQFASYQRFDPLVVADGGKSRSEFFRDSEYGDYLEAFADHFGLRKHIRLNTQVDRIRKDDAGWVLTISGRPDAFGALVICTGLAAKSKKIDCKIAQPSVKELNSPAGLDHITRQKIVVVGGGESAADYANRLAKPALNNEVLLSLRSGVRVSPRYHPVRGVPSDFLRNRLMLSVDADLRNVLGQIFVKARIKYECQFRSLFPGGIKNESETDAEYQRRKDWALRLTMAAKDELFNMFHNKSDDFLDAVGQERIRIVGPPIDNRWDRFAEFSDEGNAIIDFDPDLIVPAIGYESTVELLTNGKIGLADFYLGCCHVKYDNLFLVGFARPIIGNIPSISEMQARYVCGLIAGEYGPPANIEMAHEKDRKFREQRYPTVDQNVVYPVEMFPYCDRLAQCCGLSIGQRFAKSSAGWWRTKVTPATTLHYFGDRSELTPTYMPTSLVIIILLMKPIDWLLKIWKHVTGMAEPSL